ncbi:kelch-like protein 23 [Arctopsyche grandis]|uniref:kelch-like protein 23 n=1 Tax=Arctopsyche grandis TaxID=121162 RepID=UPI00406D938C
MKEKKFSDVFFVVRGRSFFAHLIVLSTCSEFFTNSRYKLSAIFAGFQYPVIDAILKYCYTGEIYIDDKHFKEFMELAEKLEIKNISPQYKSIDVTNCLEVLSISNDPIPKQKAMSLTVDNFETLYETSGFLKLSASVLSEILKSDKLNVNITEDVFKSLKLWVNYDIKNRESVLEELLKTVKLTSLSIEFLVNEVMDFCFSHPECSVILKQAMQSNFPKCPSGSLHSNINKIAVLGGDKLDAANTVDIFDATNDSWTLRDNFGFDRTQFVSVLVGNWIVIIGGFDSNGNEVTSVEYIDLKNGKKHQLKPLNQGRVYFSAVTLSRKSSTDVYVIGGWKNKIYLYSVERWNSKTKNWDTSIAQLLKAVHSHSASVIGDKIYVTGGRLWQSDKPQNSINTLQVYSVKSNSWSYGASMIYERESHSSIAIFVAGGFYYEKYKNIDSVERYDPNANLWTAYCTLPNPARKIGLCFYRNKLILMDLDKVWEYDDAMETWETLKSLNLERVKPNALVIPYDSII